MIVKLIFWCKEFFQSFRMFGGSTLNIFGFYIFMYISDGESSLTKPQEIVNVYSNPTNPLNLMWKHT